MKNISLSSQSVSTRYLYKNAENVDIHDKVSSGVRSVTDIPFKAVDFVSDKVHQVLKKIPLLKVAPSITHPIIKGGVNLTKNVVGSIAETGSRAATNITGAALHTAHGVVGKKNPKNNKHSGAVGVVVDGGKGAVSYSAHRKANKAKEAKKAA